jgi:uncharacterized protein DUF4886
VAFKTGVDPADPWGMVTRSRHVLAGLVAVFLGAAGYVALVHAGVLSDPFAPVLAGDVSQARSSAPGERILFVGNSFTYVNDMPGMVDRLAAAQPGSEPLFVVSYTKGSTALSYWASDGGLRGLLRDVPWNTVVLQEQSEIPSLPQAAVDTDMLPAARSLSEQATADGARTLLFMTWGYRDGDGNGDTYDAMQARLAAGYGEAASALGAGVVPVGLAWQQAHRLEPGLQLWQDDGHHPTTAGSYLGACVFYDVLTGRSPVGDSFTAGLDGDEARFLQGVAAETVAADPVS